MIQKHGCCVDKACTPANCMELPAGKTCGDCVHVSRCTTMFGHTTTDTYCDWFPRRFRERAATTKQEEGGPRGETLAPSDADGTSNPSGDGSQR